MDGQFLFVYGTLRRGFSRHKFLRALRARFVASGTARAALYDLGPYPGATPAPRDAARLAGEIYQLPNPERALKLLDSVEAFGPLSPERSPFRRQRIEVTLPSREKIEAWVYWLNRWSGPRRRIAGGDYAAAHPSESINSDD